MPVHYLTIIAARQKGKRGRETYREVARVLGPEVPDMTEDEYYDELARLMWPMIKAGLFASTPQDAPIQRSENKEVQDR
ncbi:hypothetical protein [Syntrophothermus lipocalidus]|nr:hypothetical protein [Syntrophothermus lipocalidus]